MTEKGGAKTRHRTRLEGHLCLGLVTLGQLDGILQLGAGDIFLLRVEVPGG